MTAAVPRGDSRASCHSPPACTRACQDTLSLDRPRPPSQRMMCTSGAAAAQTTGSELLADKALLSSGPTQTPGRRGACVCAAEAPACSPVLSVLKSQLRFASALGRVLLLFPDTGSVARLA